MSCKSGAQIDPIEWGRNQPGKPDYNVCVYPLSYYALYLKIFTQPAKNTFYHVSINFRNSSIFSGFIRP